MEGLEKGFGERGGGRIGVHSQVSILDWINQVKMRPLLLSGNYGCGGREDPKKTKQKKQ